MCGIAGIFGSGWQSGALQAMVRSQRHRGPDDEGIYVSPGGRAGLGHNRLRIIDLSSAGRQPMASADGNVRIVFNGEIYNYRELKAELHDYPYRSASDTEVILAAYQRWGAACLRRLLGMFALLIWDESRQELFAARDRFGVKPLCYHTGKAGTLFVASEIKALHAAGIPARLDTGAWATYLARGYQDHSERTFWSDILSLPPGHWMRWKANDLRIEPWYDLPRQVGAEFDRRPAAEVREEYSALLQESVRLRFRSDVPVGINLSGGLDSSTLLGVVDRVQGEDSEARAFTYVTGHRGYDELPWVRRMVAKTRHPLVVCPLSAEQVPALAADVQRHQDEPFGGLPTLAYARLFERARHDGSVVLLDGQGMDEQWAGYDYYAAALRGAAAATVQGTASSPVRPECLTPEFLAFAEDWKAPRPFPDPLRNAQYRDLRHTKLPRALRFNDRISMRVSTELREPFLDHRLVELAFRQPPMRKIHHGTRKRMLRQIARGFVPRGVAEAPKRPLQTPQREWLRGRLRGWTETCLDLALREWGGLWLRPEQVRAAWRGYLRGASDNSFFLWQWVSLALAASEARSRANLSKR